MDSTRSPPSDRWPGWRRRCLRPVLAPRIQRTPRGDDDKGDRCSPSPHATPGQGPAQHDHRPHGRTRCDEDTFNHEREPRVRNESTDRDRDRPEQCGSTKEEQCATELAVCQVPRTQAAQQDDEKQIPRRPVRGSTSSHADILASPPPPLAPRRPSRRLPRPTPPRRSWSGGSSRSYTAR
jgi:hypothetical protein